MAKLGTDENTSDESQHLFHLQSLQEDGNKENCKISTIVGYVFSLLYAIGMVVGTACAQALGGTIPPFELNLWRYLAHVFLSILALTIMREKPIPEKRHWLWIGLVGLFSSGFNLLYYTASTYLPLGIVGGLNPSLVIIIIAFVTLVISRECTLGVAAAVILCVLGILMVVQPEFMFSKLFPEQSVSSVYKPLCTTTCMDIPNGTELNVSAKPLLASSQGEVTLVTVDIRNGTVLNVPSNNTEALHPENDLMNENISSATTGYILLSAGSIAVSISHLLVNKKLYDSKTLAFSLWIGATGTVFSAVPMAVFERPHLPKTMTCNLLLIGHALGTGGASVCSLIALTSLEPVIVVLINSLSVPLMFIAQYTVMKNIFPVTHNSLEIAGAVFVFLGNIFSPAYKLYTDVYKTPQIKDR